MELSNAGAAAVNEVVRSLDTLDIDGLRVEWRRRFKGNPPQLRTRNLLRRFLADRIQVEAFGIDPAIERRIAQLRKAHANGRPARTPKPNFRPGVVLTREHAGRTHQVEVLDDGFRWEGGRYASLSEIARAITGVRWNGPRFFGLRETASKP